MSALHIWVLGMEMWLPANTHLGDGGRGLQCWSPCHSCWSSQALSEHAQTICAGSQLPKYHVMAALCPLVLFLFFLTFFCFPWVYKEVPSIVSGFFLLLQKTFRHLYFDVWDSQMVTNNTEKSLTRKILFLTHCRCWHFCYTRITFLYVWNSLAWIISQNEWFMCLLFISDLLK